MGSRLHGNDGIAGNTSAQGHWVPACAGTTDGGFDAGMERL